MRRAAAGFSPVFADQVLLVQVEHWQSRGRELVEILHGAGAGGAGGAGDALGQSRGQSSWLCEEACSESEDARDVIP